MEIEFDPEKDAENVRERGIPLAFGAVVLANASGEIEDRRHPYGEKRMKAFGMVEGLWFACVYTTRGTTLRIVTVHRVRQKEVRRWLEAK